MILKPKRINVRFSETEYTELQSLWPIAGVHDWTSFTRKAFASFRRDLLADQQRFSTPAPTEPAERSPALKEKDQRAAKNKPAVAKKSTKAKHTPKGPKRHTV